MINAAIVGLGRWGQNLVNSIHGKSDRIRVVLGVARTPAKAEAYAREEQIPLTESYEQALADPKVQAVILATPHSAHAEQIIAAARAGKHVFTEKPFTLTTASAVAAVEACAKAGVTLAVGYNWRFQPALQEMKRMLEDGRLGKLLHVEGNFNGPSVFRVTKDHWRQNRDEGPAGGMTGRGVHVVNAFQYLAGPIATVHAQSFRLALDYGTDDTTSMLFRFRNGATGYLSTIIATAETWRLQLFGTKGWAEVGDVEHLTTWQMRICTYDPAQPYVHVRPQTLTFPETSTERAELEHFADAVHARKPLAVPDGDEVHGVAILEAILASATSGTTVAVGARKLAKKKTPARKPVPKPRVKRPVKKK
jgi:predicted dehydrogenase